MEIHGRPLFDSKNRLNFFIGLLEQSGIPPRPKSLYEHPLTPHSHQLVTGLQNKKEKEKIEFQKKIKIKKYIKSKIQELPKLFISLNICKLCE